MQDRPPNAWSWMSSSKRRMPAFSRRVGRGEIIDLGAVRQPGKEIPRCYDWDALIGTHFEQVRVP